MLANANIGIFSSCEFFLSDSLAMRLAIVPPIYYLTDGAVDPRERERTPGAWRKGFIAMTLRAMMAQNRPTMFRWVLTPGTVTVAATTALALAVD